MLELVKKINVNYTPTDSINCNNAAQVQYTATVTTVTPTVTLAAKEVTYSGNGITANSPLVTPNSSPIITYKFYSDSNCSSG